MSNFAEIESLFSHLLTVSADELSAGERTEVKHFIDHGEYGLALETVADIYAEEKKVASPEVANLIERLAIAMSLDPASFLSRLAK
jgi:hypothetical protein